MPATNLPAIREMSWIEMLPEFEEQAVNDFYKPQVDFGLFNPN